MNPAFSNLMKALQVGEFVVTGELEPEKSTDISDVLQEARELKAHTVACNVTDNPASYGYMSSLAASHTIQQETGVEVIYQLRCSDRNRLALFSDLLGAASFGIKNILALTGDYVGLGDFPNAMPVFDYDSSHLTHMIRTMVDKQEDPNGNKIHGAPPEFNVGVAANPGADPIEPEVLKIGRKKEAGADFVQTQVVYDIDATKEFLSALQPYKLPVLVGIFPMRSYGVAKGFDMFVPGVSVPKDLMAKFKAIKKNITDKQEQRDQYDRLNLEYFAPIAKELKDSGLCAGMHIMSVHYTRITPKLLAAMGQ